MSRSGSSIYMKHVQVTCSKNSSHMNFNTNFVDFCDISHVYYIMCDISHVYYDIFKIKVYCLSVFSREATLSNTTSDK